MRLIPTPTSKSSEVVAATREAKRWCGWLENRGAAGRTKTRVGARVSADKGQKKEIVIDFRQAEAWPITKIIGRMLWEKKYLKNLQLNQSEKKNRMKRAVKRERQRRGMAWLTELVSGCEVSCCPCHMLPPGAVGYSLKPMSPNARVTPSMPFNRSREMYPVRTTQKRRVHERGNKRTDEGRT